MYPDNNGRKTKKSYMPFWMIKICVMSAECIKGPVHLKRDIEKRNKWVNQWIGCVAFQRQQYHDCGFSKWKKDAITESGRSNYCSCLYSHQRIIQTAAIQIFTKHVGFYASFDLHSTNNNNASMNNVHSWMWTRKTVSLATVSESTNKQYTC